MELYQLRTFQAVAESGNISRAAELLNTSQPAVSAQIKALEDEFGVQLFIRTSRGVELTDQGKDIQLQVKNILDQTHALENHIQNVNKKTARIIQIALNTESGVLKIDEFVSTVLHYNAHLSLKFIQNSTTDIIEKIRESKIDGGFIFGEQHNKEIHTIPLSTVKLVITAPGGWKEKLRHASMEEILKFPWILPTKECTFHPKVYSLFKKYNITPGNSLSSDYETMTLHLIRTGMGISLLPDYMSKKNDPDVYIVDRESSSINLSFAYLKKNEKSEVFQNIITALTKIWH